MSEGVDIQTVKTFWDTRPCNRRQSKSTIGTRQYFDEVTERRYFVEPHIIEFCEFPKLRDRNVLETGCGIGTAAVQFAQHGAHYTGIELSDASLQIAKSRFESFNLKGEFIQLDAELADSHDYGMKFDLHYSFGVIHRTPLLKEI